jgi:cytochrome b subunit of formate dehydrogenase
MCGKERDGIEVQDDFVLGAVRWFKRNVTKDEKKNRIVVCRDCYPQYKKRRGAYNFRQKLYLALGVAFLLISLVMSPRATTIVVSLLVLAMLYLFSLMSYTPRIAEPKGGIAINK